MIGMMDLKFIYAVGFAMGVCFFMIGFGGVIIPFIGTIMMGDEFIISSYALASLSLSGFLFVLSLTLFGCDTIISWYQKHKNPGGVV